MAQQEVLDFLKKNKGKKFSASQLVSTLNLSKYSAHEATRKLKYFKLIKQDTKTETINNHKRKINRYFV